MMCIRLVLVGYLGPRLQPCGVAVVLLPLLAYVVVVVVVYLLPVRGRVLTSFVYVVVLTLCSGRHGLCVCVFLLLAWLDRPVCLYTALARLLV